MSDFDEAVVRERERLLGLISEAEGKIGELNAEVSVLRRRVEALDAYERIKTGKLPGKPAPKKASRPLRPAAVLSMLKGSSGMSLAQILGQLGAQPSSDEGKAISVLLMNLTLKGQVALEDGLYTAA